MPYKQNVGNGVSAAKDTATEADVRYPKTFHAGKGTKAKIGRILDCAIRRITPKREKQVISKGSYIANDIEIDGEDNLVSGNIRANTSIFGVRGDDNVVDTSDGNLDGSVMLKNAHGYSKGRRFDGEIETLNDRSFSPSDGSAYNDCKIIGSAQNDYVGAFDYSILGYIAGRIRVHIANLVEKNVRDGVKVGGIGGYILGSFTRDATATKADILKGKTAGIKGQMLTGEMENIAAVDPAKSVIMLNGVLYVRMSNGAHIKNAASGYPEVSVPQQSVASAAGVNGDYILDTATYLGVKGKIKSMDGFTIFPQAFRFTVSCARKFLLSNFVVAAVPFPPANVLKNGYRYWIGDSYIDGTYVYSDIIGYYYQAPNEMMGVTGGWDWIAPTDQKPNPGTLSRQQGYMEVKMNPGSWSGGTSSGSNNVSCFVCTARKLDLTNIRTIYMPFADGSIGSSTTYFGISNELPNSRYWNNYVAKVSGNPRSGTQLILDVSNITGSYYLIIEVDAYYGSSSGTSHNVTRFAEIRYETMER